MNFFLCFQTVNQLLTQAVVIIQRGYDILYKKCIHHQTHIENILQFMRCQRSDAHALIGGVHNQLFLCQSLQCLLDRGIADLIFASKLLDVQLFSGLEYLRENIIFNILINLISQGSFFTRCFVVLSSSFTGLSFFRFLKLDFAAKRQHKNVLLYACLLYYTTGGAKSLSIFRNQLFFNNMRYKTD